MLKKKRRYTVGEYRKEQFIKRFCHKKRHADKSDLLTLLFWTHCCTYTGNKMLMISYEMIAEGLY